MTITMNDFINQQQTQHTNARVHETISDCTVTKLDASAIDKLSKGRRANAYTLTTSEHVVSNATNIKQVLQDVNVDNGIIIRYSVDVFEREYGKLKLGVLYQHEIGAYLQYIDYIYVGLVYDESGRTHNCGLYGFELVVPNIFKVQFVSLNMFNSEYTKYDDDVQLMGHMCSFIDG